MLKRLTLENFKAFETLDLELGPVTVLFGPNSAGKSSVQQFLMLLKQTKESANRRQALALDGPYVDFGAFSDIVHQHDESLHISWMLYFDYYANIKISQELPIFDMLSKNQVAGVGAKIGCRNQSPVTESITYRFGEASFCLKENDQGEKAFDLVAQGLDGFKFERNEQIPGDLPGPLRGYGFPDKIRTLYNNADFLSDLQLEFENNIDWIYHIGPLRDPAKRYYVWSRVEPLGVGERGERTIEAILAASHLFVESPDDENRKIPFQEAIAYWLREMGLIHSFHVEEIAQKSNVFVVKVKTHVDSAEVLLTDVGFGVSQVLPIIVCLYYVPWSEVISGFSMILIEQPELHLHPLAQVILADLILLVTKRRNLQVIVETHSEHFLMRLQRRIAEEKASADDAKLYFCSSSRGKSIAEPLLLNALGEIENWPENFFGDAFGETMSAEKARVKRVLKS